MKTIFLGFQNTADACIKDASVRGKIIAAAVAVAVASKLGLPSAAVDNPADYFEQQLRETARSLVGEFNEAMTFDFRGSCALVRSYWLVRCSAAYPLNAAVFGARYGYFDALCGVGMHVEPDHYEFANRYKSEILALAGVACGILGELQKNG